MSEDTSLLQEKSSQIFDTYLILAAGDWKNVKNNIPYIQKNISCRNIYLVSSKKLQTEDLCGCIFVDEDEVLKEQYGLTFQAVKDYLESMGAMAQNAGWFFQQFIKLGLSKIIHDSYYLAWDGDTVPLNSLEFFDKNGRPYLNLKREYFSVYFRTIKNLFGINKITKESFISEHMLFNANLVQEMLAVIEENLTIDGTFFWQKILNASDLLHFDFIKDDQRFFSEFETFGTYCDYYAPKLYVKRKLRTLRHGADFLGLNPSKELMDWAAKDFDTISFEEWGVPIPEMMDFCNNPSHREKMTFANTIRLFFKKERRKIFENFPHINHEQFRNFFEKTVAKMNFDFFFGKKLAYSTRHLVFEDSLLQKFRLLYITKCRIQRYWRLLTFHF